MTQREIFALRDRTIATLNWASLAFRPGSMRRVAADGIVAKLRMPSTVFVPGDGTPGCLDALHAFGLAAGRLNEKRHAFPGSHKVDADELAGAAVCEDAMAFVRSQCVSFGEVRWLLSVNWPGGNLAEDVKTLLGRFEAIEDMFVRPPVQAMAA